MQVEVWADVVCPWCYIGKRRLQSALEQRGLADDVEIVHRAFQLDPTASTTTEPTIDISRRSMGCRVMKLSP